MAADLEAALEICTYKPTAVQVQDMVLEYMS
jgi:hypothetical protein